MAYDGRPWLVRFWEKVPVPVGDECMEWTGARTAWKYGQICRNGKQLRAHRVMAEIYYGPLPAGVQVCHRCDNPPCVRPDHLFLGTAKDNARDRQNKGRFTPPRFTRENHPRALLTTEQVLEIQAEARAGASGPQLGKKYGVSPQTIYNVWKESA